MPALNLSTTSHQIPICEHLNLCTSILTGTCHILLYTCLQLQVISKADASKMFERRPPSLPTKAPTRRQGAKSANKQNALTHSKTASTIFLIKKNTINHVQKKKLLVPKKFLRSDSLYFHTSSISARHINYIMCNKCASYKTTWLMVGFLYINQCLPLYTQT